MANNNQEQEEGFTSSISVEDAGEPYLTAPRGKARSNKSSRVETRVSPDQKDLFERAAAIRGMNLTDYVRSVLQHDAEETISQHEVMHLSDRDRKAFVEAFINPPPPNEALRRAFDTEHEWIAPESK